MSRTLGGTRDNMPPMQVAPAAPAAVPPDLAEVDRIAGLANRVVRNLEITECYARLSAAMRSRTGELANWCTFATWASKQAGSTIRGEDFLDTLRRHLGRRAVFLAPVESISRALLRRGLFEPDTRFGGLVAEIHTPFDAFERASEQVADGNLKVFAEIGREFARFLRTVPADAPVGSPALEQFLSGLRPGPPPDGQDYLAEAFTGYQAQAHEQDPGTRAALVLLANLKIGLHEQTRLQPQIAAAVDAPLTTAADLGERVLHRLVPASRNWPAVLHGPSAFAAGLMATGVHRAAIRLTRDAITESLMVIVVPGAVLRLGRDLVAPVPAVLAGRHRDLDALVAVYDACPPGGTQCGATDWCDLKQRMHYIVHLFRAYAVDPTLFSPPFTDAQVAAFRAGRVPDGSL
jgi:hypothetical protein